MTKQAIHRLEKYSKAALLQSIKAINRSALVPLKTEIILKNKNYSNEFIIRRLISNLPPHLNSCGPRPNPFIPWDKNLEIAKIFDDHILILNKYPVQKGHMLLITSQWQPQNGWLTRKDWKAVSEIENDTKGLWFFNSGPKAGASQPHRHIQLLPRTHHELICPRDEWFTKQMINDVEKFDFDCSSYIIAERKREISCKSTDLLYKQYIELCKVMQVGDPSIDAKPNVPYNLVFSDNWISLFRRRMDSMNGFSINGLGFAGYILAINRSDIAWLEKTGPHVLLKEVLLPIN